MGLTADLALARLREGNRRFVANQAAVPAPFDAKRRAALVAGQEPFAIILGCSDSRVPAEMVFDQGFGNLFVIRVAGNIVAPSQIGSVEFAAARFGKRLVVIMGHTQCGAIQATLDELQGRGTHESRNLRSIVDRVRPSLEPLLARGQDQKPEELPRQAVRANVRNSVAHLRKGSQLLEHLIRVEGLKVLSAEYSLETGEVDFLEGVSADSLSGT
jgi:carbonic anhydrase